MDRVDLMDPMDQAVDALRHARGLLVSAGAGMGVDSGLPDFRGPEGFWRAYPPYRRLGLRFEELANPRWFASDPELAWGFYGHRMMLYRATVPHDGFAALLRLGARAPGGFFVFTSNVDGQFAAAGFPEERVVECHGSLRHLQCTRHCGVGIMDAAAVRVEVDEHTMRARPPLPACPGCGALTRPNVLMFGDGDWDGRRTEAQQDRFAAWLDALEGGLCVVECGAGTAVPTVRLLSERLCRHRGAALIRINPREPEVPEGALGLSLGARQALTTLAARVLAA